MKTQGMTPEQYADIQTRQKRLLSFLGKDIFILLSGHDCYRNSHNEYAFRQGSNFAYLTGFPEKGCVAVFDPTADAPVTLFVKERIQVEEVWQGFTIGVVGTRERYPVDTAVNVKELESKLRPRLRGRRVHFLTSPAHPLDGTITEMIADSEATFVSENSAQDELTRMRVVKSAWEIAQIRRAVELTGEAQHAAMRATPASRWEFEVEAAFEYKMKCGGARGFSFQTIVASGPRATCQHYVANDAALDPDGLVLLDGGAEWNCYAGDLTRTWPASGTFNQVQRDLYEVVLASEKAGVEATLPGAMLDDIQRRSAEVLLEGLKDLGLAHGSTAGIVESGAYKEFWPGFIGHMIGLDVHDVTPAKAFRGLDATEALGPGMIFTVEPGFYSQAFNCQMPMKFQGIGIRIEDVVLVTEDGNENLSRDVVKEIEDVESMIQLGHDE
jgi:Xaa-Pro aminopeptidase